MKALVVDDNPAERDLLKRLLDRYGWETEEAESGREALGKVEASHPDLIVSDGMMPDMDGFQLLREVRRRSETPFVLYSGIYTGGEERDLALSLGADAFLPKPLSPRDLIREISAVMERRPDGGTGEGTHLDEETYLRRYGALLAEKLRQKVEELEGSRRREPGNRGLETEIFRRRSDIDEIVRTEEEYARVHGGAAAGAEGLPPEMRNPAFVVPRLTRPLDCVEASLSSFRARFEERLGEKGEGYLRGIESSSRRMRRIAEELLAASAAGSREAHQQLKRLEVFSGMLLREYRDHLDEEGRLLTEKIAGCCLDMQRLVDDVLDLLKVATVQLRWEPVDLSAAVRRIVRALADAEPERRVDVRLEEGCRSFGDPHLLRILMENLLDNAWKFTRNTRSPVITFGPWKSGSFRLADNGSGFDPGRDGDIFAPFVRGALAREYPGTGIGLAIARTVINRHGGSISAVGRPGKGTEVIFTLPGSRAAYH